MIRKYDLLTLLIPSIFSFVNIYICISFIMVSVSPFHDKKDIFALHGPSIEKTIYLALTNQSLLVLQPNGLWVLVELSTIQVVSTYSDFNPSDCVLCVEPRKPLLVHWHSQLIYLYPCAVIILIQGSRSHTFAQKTPINPLILVV